MSRAIKNATIKPSFEAFHNGNKLIFTKVKGRMGAYLVKNDRLVAVNLMIKEQENMGAIYIGKVKNVVKNLNACFVEIAEKEICYLPMKEAENPFLINREFDGRILEGDELLVQITRAAQKTKQASVTTNITLDNDYFVLSLKKGLQFSKRIAKERCHEMEVFLKSSDILNTGGDSSDSIPGILIRTKTASLENQEVSDHLKAFLEEWNQLLQSAKHRTCFTCLKKKEGFTFNTVLNSFVDLQEFDEIITDEPKIMKELEDFATKNQKAIRLYEDKAFPLSGLYGLTSKMDDAINTRVWLKSGAYLVIEHTEALTTIDVNTGKNESHKAMSDVQFNVNLEAAEEIAVQLRLRNLSGIIIVDFINCKDDEQKHALLKKLRDLVKEDIVPTKVIDMTPLGLVEITRKKVLKPLREQYFKEKSI